MNRFPRVSLLPVMTLMLGLAGCSGQGDPSSDTSSTEAVTPPAAPADPGELAENIYDATKAGDWAVADAKLDTLNSAVAASGTGQEPFDRVELDRLNHGLASRDRFTALEASNELTRDFASATAASSPIPVEVVLLDFYGRELEIGAELGEPGIERLQRTASEIRGTWDAVRPTVVERGGSAEAQSFEALVQRVEAARTSADYGAVATPVLDEVDLLEAVFQR